MQRPTLNKNISLTDFNEFYWLKEELVAFCRTEGISTAGGKLELAKRIQTYLSTGEVVKPKPIIKKSKSTFDWKTEALTPSTIITDSYKNSENVRAFFLSEIGSHFSFNVKFMNWMKQATGKTLQDAVDEWKKINDLKKDKNYQTEIAPQFEYNRYIRAFLADNPALTTKDAMKYWKLKKAQRGSNEYERADLKLIEHK